MSKTKECTKCNRVFPATLEYFNKQKQNKSGLHSWCKSCIRDYKKSYYEKNKDEINNKKMEKYYQKHPKQIKENIPDGYKKCSKCRKIKLKTDFGKSSKAKDGLRYSCKDCRKIEHLENQESYILKSRKWYKENKERASKRNKEYKEENREWYRKYDKQYYEEHREEIIQRSKEYLYDRIENDLGFKLLQRCRNRLYKAIKRNDKSARTQQLLGCTNKELINHLESQFKEGMTWDNYGEWHIDHIIPCASFDFTKEEEQYECFNYKNLQPLWAEENYRKSDKVKTS